MNGRIDVIVRHYWPVVSLVLLLGAIFLLAGVAGSPLIQRTVTEAFIMVVLVVGLQIFIGNSGVVSFGHISFMAVAAYATAWQTCCPDFKAFILPGLPEFLAQTQVPSLAAVVTSVILAGAFAFVIGLAIIRLTGIGASIAMFAVLSIVNTVYSNWDSVTGGESSIIGLPTYSTLPVAFLGALIAVAVAHLYKSSRLGLALRASRDDEFAARAAGVNVYWQRLIAFVLSAIVVGFGGVLHAHFIGTVSIDIYWIGLTFITLAMLVVGGMRSLAGAVVGVVVISALIEGLRQLENGVDFGLFELAAPAGVQEIGLAIVLLLILIFRPSGITRGHEFVWTGRIFSRLAAVRASRR